MATVYLAIGTAKVGTTAVQSFLRENEKNLEKQGYCYPFMDLGLEGRVFNRNAHFLIYAAEDVADREEKKEKIAQVRESGFQILDGLAKEFPNIIISDELIWQRSSKKPGFWKNVKAQFEKIGCDVKIIVYLRRQDLFIQSFWRQSVKAMSRLEKTFEECIGNGKFDYYPLDYYQQLCKIQTSLGKENMIVRVYENDQFEGEEHSIFSDFLKYVGVQMTDEFTKDFTQEDFKSSNIGLEGNYLEIKRLLNGVPEYKDMEDFMRNPIYLANCYQMGLKLHSKVGMFSYEEQLEYMQQFDEGNRKVAKEFLGRKDGKLFYEPIESMPKWKIEPETMYRDLLMCMAEIFCQQEKKIIMQKQELDARKKEFNAQKKEIAKLKSKVEKIDKSLIFRSYRKAREVLKKS